jgi:guanylate kinase
LVVVSGPSGAGKTTLLREIFQRSPLPLVPSISATTRPPRKGERNGVDYHFLSPEEFERRRLAGDFLECCEVFGRGYWYGTLTSEVTPSLAAGKWVVLEIDVEGAAAVKAKFPEAITVFILPESDQELQRRLRGRGTESEQDIQRRLDVARRECAAAKNYRHQVVNDQVERAADEICDLLNQAAGENDR